MASKCKTCDEEIHTADFVKCYGFCMNTFHSKCVSIGKTLLNALGSNPNIRWYCHDCNTSNPIVSSVNEIKESIGHLSTSLSTDLGKFLESMSTMTNCVTKSLSSISNSKTQNASPVFSGLNANNSTNNHSSSKRRRGESSHSNPNKIRCTNNRSSQLTRSSGTSNPVSNNSDDTRKSIVVSNIAADMNVIELSKFLSSKLNVSEHQIKITTLVPSSIKPEDIRFMQFRISVPVNLYETIKSLSLWPPGVRIRDFVFKNKKSVNVSKPSPVAKNLFSITSERLETPLLSNDMQPNVIQPQAVIATGKIDFLGVPSSQTSTLATASEMEQTD